MATTRATTLTPGSDWVAARGEKWLAQLSGMEATLAPVDEPLIRALALEAPLRIAEIGCGGGGTTLAILRAAPAGSVVHGFDISNVLIAAARQRTGHDDRSIAFETADMATATATGVPYDCLVSRFGIMFFADPPAAFANLARWLAPGGRFVFAVWGALAENAWMTTTHDAVAEVVDLPASEPDAPGPFRYEGATKLLALLSQAGFGELDASVWRGVLPIGGGLAPVDAASFALAAYSSFGERLAEAGGGALDRARNALAARFSEHELDGIVQVGACVHIVTGERLG